MTRRNAEEYVEWLNAVCNSTEPVVIAQEDTDDFTLKLNDMKNILEETMEILFTYDGLYKNINETYVEFESNCNRIDGLAKEIDAMNEGKQLIEKTRGLIIDTQNDLQVSIYG